MNLNSPLLTRLRSHYLFSGLEQEDFGRLGVQIQHCTLQRKEVLFHRGDVADSFYFVLTGQIELGFVAPNGEKKILEVFGPNRMFAEAVAFMRRQVFPATAQAVTDAEVLRVPSTPYVDLLYNNPEACLRLLADISQHLHARVIDVERSTVQSAKTRFIAFLLDELKDQREGHATISLSLPKHVIASRLSIKPETLSRILRVMVEEQLISEQGKVITIPDVIRLRQAL